MNANPDNRLSEAFLKFLEQKLSEPEWTGAVSFGFPDRLRQEASMMLLTGRAHAHKRRLFTDEVSLVEVNPYDIDICFTVAFYTATDHKAPMLARHAHQPTDA